MTRVLSELLGAKEPAFRLGLHKLEQASGGTSADIRLSNEITQAAKAKLRALGLDPNDTTGQELYGALMQRVREDDKRLMTLLGSDTADGDVQSKDNETIIAYIRRLLVSIDMPKQAFVLKQSAIKKILKKHPPKKAMKLLGYRSVDSMLKHEPVGQLYAAAWTCEAAPWHKSITIAYKQLLPRDFEPREVTVLAPQSKRWEALAAKYVADVKHNILCFKELGVIVLLPLGNNAVAGAGLAMLVLGLHDIAAIHATSTYLKLHQVRPDFGSFVADVSQGEIITQAQLAGQRLPWHLVQRYFSRNQSAYNPEIFEPHVQREDLSWRSVESTIVKLHPAFEFWHGAGHIGFLQDGQPVSFNLTDAALNFCNHMPYEQRIVQYFRDHLWHELMLRYMHQGNLEQLLHEQLADELLDAKALA